MLKPAGETFHVFCYESPCDRVFDAMFINPKWSKYDDANYASQFYKDPKVKDIYKELFEGCGFIDCVVKYEDNIYQFSDEKEFKGMCILVNENSNINLLKKTKNNYNKSKIWNI